jgi:FAD/FMN-containing dehydrogenase
MPIIPPSPADHEADFVTDSALGIDHATAPDDTRAEDLQAALACLDDAALFISGHDAEDRYREDWSGGRGCPLAVLRPRTPQHVALAIAAVGSLRLPVAIQGGMTGLVGACVPQPGEVVLSLERLNQIEEIDETNQTMTVQAGVKLQEAQEAAAARGLLFPIDIGSKGSCHVGGIIATNAGGNRVLRYGMTRQSVLGLEVVLPDGQIVTNLNKATKDNAGYDLKHLFIGSEGTLGVITRAVFALQPLPRSTQTAIVGVQDFSQVVALLRHCRHRLGPKLTSFEVMWRDFYDIVTRELSIGRPAFPVLGTHLVLVEAMGQDPDVDDEAFANVLGDFLADVSHTDAVLATSIAEASAFWAVREASGEAAAAVRPYAAFDVSLPIASMENWVNRIHGQLDQLGVTRTQTYGHLGDGNLHLVAGYPQDRPELKSQICDLVHRSIGELGGSVSAEHGIGITKKPYLGLSRTPEEIALMQAIKRAIDPHQLLNRNRVFDLP